MAAAMALSGVREDVRAIVPNPEFADTFGNELDTLLSSLPPESSAQVLHLQTVLAGVARFLSKRGWFLGGSIRLHVSFERLTDLVQTVADPQSSLTLVALLRNMMFEERNHSHLPRLSRWLMSLEGNVESLLNAGQSLDVYSTPNMTRQLVEWLRLRQRASRKVLQRNKEGSQFVDEHNLFQRMTPMLYLEAICGRSYVIWITFATRAMAPLYLERFREDRKQSSSWLHADLLRYLLLFLPVVLETRSRTPRMRVLNIADYGGLPH